MEKDSSNKFCRILKKYYIEEDNMTKDKLIEENFSDILSMLKKKVQEKDEEIVRLREENIKLKEKLTEINPDFVLEETFKRR